jgi:ribosomal protein S12 methylthiotransferase accessory factor
MRLTTTYLNQRLQLLDAIYGADRQAQYAAIAHLYNRILGPITSVNVHRPELLDLSMYSGSANHSPVGFLMRDLSVKAGIADTIFIPGGGKGGTWPESFVGTLGEVAERLLAVLHFQAVADELEWTTFAELIRQGRRALGPDDLPLFAAEQHSQPGFGYVPFTADSPLRWIEGCDLVTGDPVMVPAQLVLIYYKHRRGEAHIGYPTTGGLVFHPDRQRAILHGLYEVIERDVINIRWYSKLVPPHIEVNLIDFLAQHLGVRYARMSTPSIQNIQLFVDTLDIPIPVLTAIAIDRSRSKYAFLGGGGAWSGRERALRQTLFELGQSRTSLKFFRPVGMKNIRADADVSELTDFFDAAVYFGYEENWPKLDWYMASEERLTWEDVPSLHFDREDEEYAAMLDRLHAAGFTPMVLDFSGACWPEVSVIKVLVPELTQACIPSHPYLGHPRFYELPRQLGLVDRRLTFRDLNPYPVPFP